MNNNDDKHVITRRMAALVPAALVGAGVSASAFAQPTEPVEPEGGDSEPIFGAVTFRSDDQSPSLRSQAQSKASDSSALAFTLKNTSNLRVETSDGAVALTADIQEGHSSVIPVEFSSGAAVDVVAQENGSAVALPSESGSEVNYGILEAPTLITADGTATPGRYVANGTGVAIAPEGTTTLPSDIVALKAGFTYTVTYNSKDLAPGGYVSQKDALKELKRCFNCSFPIKGATKAFPKKGVTFHLTVTGGFKAPVKITKANSSTGSWEFTALKGHFDAAGSTLLFNIIAGRDNEFVLGVTAKVKGTKVPEFLNKTHAKATWRKFALRTCQNVKSH